MSEGYMLWRYAAGGTPTLPEAAQRLKKEGIPCSYCGKGEGIYFTDCHRMYVAVLSVRSKVLWTYVQGVLGRTSKGALNDVE